MEYSREMKSCSIPTEDFPEPILLAAKYAAIATWTTSTGENSYGIIEGTGSSLDMKSPLLY